MRSGGWWLARWVRVDKQTSGHGHHSQGFLLPSQLDHLPLPQPPCQHPQVERPPHSQEAVEAAGQHHLHHAVTRDDGSKLHGSAAHQVHRPPDAARGRPQRELKPAAGPAGGVQCWRRAGFRRCGGVHPATSPRKGPPPASYAWVAACLEPVPMAGSPSDPPHGAPAPRSSVLYLTFPETSRGLPPPGWRLAPGGGGWRASRLTHTQERCK